MRAIRTTTVSILAIGLLAGSAAAVAAQDEEAVELTTPLYYTGSSGEPAEVIDGTFDEENDTLRGQQVLGVPIEAEDPRLGGLLDIVINGQAEVTDEAGAVLESRSYRTVNEGGAWVGSGTFVDVWDPVADEALMTSETIVMHGEGDYEGLVAFVTVDHLGDGSYEGVVLRVDAPPVPEPYGLLAGSALGVAAQDEAAPPVEFTAQWAWGPSIRSEATTAVASGAQNRGGAWRPGVLAAATDPRWRGSLSVANNEDDYGAAGGPLVGIHAFRIENEDGAWQQMPTVGLILPGVDDLTSTGVFVGEGDYAGLISVVNIATDRAAGVWDLHGYIIDGELPPAPEPYVTG